MTRFGVSLPMYDVESGRVLPPSEIAEYAAEAEELGFESLWVMDHYRLENTPKPTAGHDPLITLACVAARTTRATLGTLVACDAFRPAGQLAREAVALSAASGGRFVLGIGSGWGEEEFNAFDYPFSFRTSRFQETLEVLAPLLHGEHVSYQGQFSRLDDAYLVTGGVPAPPIWVAAFAPRMLGLTARYADGWNTAWHGTDTSRFERELGALRAAVSESERAPDRPIEISVGLWTLPLEGAELDSAIARGEALRGPTADESWPSPARERMVTGGPESIATSVRRYLAAGAEHVIFNLSVTPFSLFDRSLLGKLAPVLALVRD